MIVGIILWMHWHNDLALPEFGPFPILKNTHVVLKLWRIFGFKDRRNFLSKATTFDFCIGYNSITFFKTCPIQCTVHVYLPWVFCEIAFGCANSFILILWAMGTDVTEKDIKNMVWYGYKNLGYHATTFFIFNLIFSNKVQCVTYYSMRQLQNVLKFR